MLLRRELGSNPSSNYLSTRYVLLHSHSFEGATLLSTVTTTILAVGNLLFAMGLFFSEIGSFLVSNFSGCDGIVYFNFTFPLRQDYLSDETDHSFQHV